DSHATADLVAANARNAIERRCECRAEPRDLSLAEIAAWREQHGVRHHRLIFWTSRVPPFRECSTRSSGFGRSCEAGASPGFGRHGGRPPSRGGPFGAHGGLPEASRSRGGPLGVQGRLAAASRSRGGPFGAHGGLPEAPRSRGGPFGVQGRLAAASRSRGGPFGSHGRFSNDSRSRGGPFGARAGLSGFSRSRGAASRRPPPRRSASFGFFLNRS